ncbi:MAG: hypothetical protein IJ861_04635 [Clostridia bacterium]|nr:hypothetical protein [Clostridia bacterium]
MKQIKELFKTSAVILWSSSILMSSFAAPVVQAYSFEYACRYPVYCDAMETFIEGVEPYTFEAISGWTNVDSFIAMNGYAYEVKSDAVVTYTTYPDGKIYMENYKGDYMFSAIFNEGLCSLPWFNIAVLGTGSCQSTLEIVDDGMILTEADLTNKDFKALNRDEELNAHFSTNKTSVKFMAVDDKTLGVYTDEDDDGIYETLIADSNGRHYDKDENPELRMNRMSAQSVESVESTGMNDMVFIIITAALAAILSVIFLAIRKRHQSKV